MMVSTFKKVKIHVKDMKVQYLILLALLFVIPFVSGEIQDIGSVKQNQCIVLKQNCPNCTYVNLTSVSIANHPSFLLIGSESMNKTGTEYTFNFCNTSIISNDYSYCTLGDIDGVDTTVCVSFSVTPSGFTGTLGFYFILLIIVFGLIVLGFAAQEYWFLVLAGLGLIMLGIYSINQGIAGFKDMFMTWGIGLFEIGVGTILGIGAAWQKINENDIEW